MITLLEMTFYFLILPLIILAALREKILLSFIISTILGVIFLNSRLIYVGNNDPDVDFDIFFSLALFYLNVGLVLVYAVFFTTYGIADFLIRKAEQKNE